MTDQTVNPVRQAVAPLIGNLQGMIQRIADDDLDAGIFFVDVLNQLREAQDEGSLINTFIHVSTVAFQGWVFAPETVELIDEFLASCERVAQTFGVSTDQPH